LSIAIGIALCLVALILGVIVGNKVLGTTQAAVPQEERQKLVEAARAEAESLKQKAQLEA